MKECITHHHACDCRERHFAKIDEQNRELKQRLIDLRQSSRGKIVNEYGDPMYALIPLSVLNDQ